MTIRTDARKYYPGIASQAEVHWIDNEDLEFGDDADVTLKWNSVTSVLEFLPVTNNVGAVTIGNGTDDIDFKVFMGSATEHVTFDNDIARVIFEGTDLRIMDTDILQFGDDADVAITWDNNSLNIVPLVNDTGRVEIGNGTESFDLIVFGSTVNNYMEWDSDSDRLNVVVAGRTITGEEHAVDISYRGTLSIGESMVGCNVVVTPTGTGGNWVSAFFGKVLITNADDPIPGTGYPCGAEFEVESEPAITPSQFAVLVLNDTYDAAHQAGSAYIWIRKYGDTWPINLFNFWEEALGSAYDSGRMVVVTAGTPSCTQLVRCTVGGADMWLMAINSLPGS